MHIVGLDLGQAADFTAACILRRRASPDPARPEEGHYDLMNLRRYELGTSYPAVVDRVSVAVRGLPGEHRALAVDQTGVGRPVVDMLYAKALPCSLYPITITAGGQATRAEDGWHVPKKELVTTLVVLYQQGRMRADKELPNAGLLEKEVQNFRMRITKAGNETFEAWREGAHDDLVLAVAMATWVGERFGGGGGVTASVQVAPEGQGGVLDRLRAKGAFR